MADIEISSENHLTRLWHTNCAKWTRRGQNTSAVMRYVRPDAFIHHDDESKLYLAECLHCDGKAYIGLDRQRRVIVLQYSTNEQPKFSEPSM